MKQRLITGVIAGAGFLAVLAWGGLAYAALILLLAVIGYKEFNQMNKMNGGPLAIIGLLGLLELTVPWEELFDLVTLPGSTTIWILMFVLFAVTVITKNKWTLDHAALSLLGVVYIALGFHAMIAVRLADHGIFWSLLLFFCIWGTDSGAYFSGRAFGKRKLWPSISPNKTIEGAAGGVVVSILVAIAFSLYAPDLLNIGRAAGIGILIGFAGQMGDLIQSAYKRVRDIKDSGTILPGHGGVLDRCDSWLIVFPLVYLLGLLPI